MTKPRYAGTVLALLVASALLATAALALTSEAPGGVCIAPQAPLVAHAAPPAQSLRQIETVQARVAVREQVVRRTVESLESALSARAADLEARLAALEGRRELALDGAIHAVNGAVVRLELADAFAAVDVDDGHGMRFEPALELDADAWSASDHACRFDRPLAGGLELLVHVAKAPARGVGLALDAVVAVAKVVPTILRVLV